MNKDQVKGRTEKAKGSVKEAAGKATGNRSLENKGKAEQVGGKVQSTYGDAKDKVKKSTR